MKFAQFAQLLYNIYLLLLPNLCRNLVYYSNCNVFSISLGSIASVRRNFAHHAIQNWIRIRKKCLYSIPGERPINGFIWNRQKSLEWSPWCYRCPFGRSLCTPLQWAAHLSNPINRKPTFIFSLKPVWQHFEFFVPCFLKCSHVISVNLPLTHKAAQFPTTIKW